MDLFFQIRGIIHIEKFTPIFVSLLIDNRPLRTRQILLTRYPQYFFLFTSQQYI